MEIDAAVTLVLGLVHAHLMDSVATGRPDPASWLPSFGIGCKIRAEDRFAGELKFTLATGSARRHRGHEIYPGAAADGGGM